MRTLPRDALACCLGSRIGAAVLLQTHTRRRWLSVMGHVATAVLLVLALIAWVPSAATGESPPRPTDSLRAAAQGRGTVRAILTLRLPEGLVGAHGADAMIRREAAVARARRAVIERLGPEGARVLRAYQHIPALAVELTAEGLERALATHEILSVQEDALAKPLLTTSTVLIGADTAWSRGYTGQGQAIVILDTGVDAEHPFLEGRVVEEACFSTTYASHGATSLCPSGAEVSTEPGSARPCSGMAGCGHGTHVAGIAAGSGPTMSGVAPDADIVAIQVFSRFDQADLCGGDAPCIMSYTSDQLAALDYVYATLRSRHSIAAVNMSLGGSVHNAPCDGIALAPIIEALYDVGIVTVVATGNDGAAGGLSEPACVSAAVSVGSTTSARTDSVDRVSLFSNSAWFMDLLAPGQYVESAIPGGGYECSAGTSMAAPHVVGALAVLRSAAPTADAETLLAVLKSTGVDILDERNGLVKPRIQVDAALAALVPDKPPPPAREQTPVPPDDPPATPAPLHLPLVVVSRLGSAS